MAKRRNSSAAGQGSPNERQLRHQGEDYGARGLHGQAGTTKGDAESSRKGGGRDLTPDNDAAHGGHPATTGQKPARAPKRHD